MAFCLVLLEAEFSAFKALIPPPVSKMDEKKELDDVVAGGAAAEEVEGMVEEEVEGAVEEVVKEEVEDGAAAAGGCVEGVGGSSEPFEDLTFFDDISLAGGDGERERFDVCVSEVILCFCSGFCVESKIDFRVKLRPKLRPNQTH